MRSDREFIEVNRGFRHPLRRLSHARTEPRSDFSRFPGGNFANRSSALETDYGKFCKIAWKVSLKLVFTTREASAGAFERGSLYDGKSLLFPSSRN